MIAQAELYTALAEALAEPPAWLAGPGPSWPLFTAAVRVAHQTGSQAARRAVVALADLPPEPLSLRRQRYRQLFTGPGRPRLALYESLYRHGRLLGPVTFTLQALYRAAGLEVVGAELPDHASVELAFLAYLAEREASEPDQAAAWRQTARQFLRRHAGRWLPDLGRAIAASGDAVYTPIGQLLADLLMEAMEPSSPARSDDLSRLPTVVPVEACTLCGFCVQVCPTQALAIQETEAETRLVLRPAACTGCGRCEGTCSFDALHLQGEGQATERATVVLRRSPRALCPLCGRPTVSQAEMAVVGERLDWPVWLPYCLECRADLGAVSGLRRRVRTGATPTAVEEVR